MKQRQSGKKWPQIAIIGAGFAGLGMAIRLKQAGCDSFTIYEKSDSVGGTWRDNIYPGAACDVPSHLYCYSFAPKSDWTHRFSRQPEILDYIENCVERFRLRPHIRFKCGISDARFDEAKKTWALQLENGETTRAHMVIYGCGQLNRPHIPAFPGLDSFQGTAFHSARWQPDVDFEGKRVAVIGNGASAIQFIPHVAEKAARLDIYQRSPAWVIPRKDRAYAPLTKAAFKHLPFIHRLYRSWIYLAMEARFAAFHKGALLSKAIEWQARRHLKDQVKTASLHEALTPDYPVGCKRILISDDYYPSLDNDTVNLICEPVKAISPTGIITDRDKERPADIIIFATGFQATDFLAPIHVTGRNGRTLADAWADGAQAHMGMMVPDFPNMFILYGPNTNLGHNSIIFMIEAQIRYIMDVIARMRRDDADLVSIKPEDMIRYSDETQRALNDTVWAADCGSWYKTKSGKITNNWPGFTMSYWRKTRRADPSVLEMWK